MFFNYSIYKSSFCLLILQIFSVKSSLNDVNRSACLNPKSFDRIEP